MVLALSSLRLSNYLATSSLVTHFFLLSAAGNILLLWLVCRPARFQRERQTGWQTAAVLQSLGFFTASVLHNIAGPLSTLSAVLAEARPQLSNQQYQDLMVSLNFVFTVVRHARQHLRHEPPQTESIPLAQILGETQELVRQRALRQRIAIRLDCPDGLTLSGDQALLRQILLNLVQNSFESLSRSSCGLIILRARRSGQNVVVEISDNGPGMNRGQLDRLGKGFYSAKCQGAGLGITFVMETLRHGLPGRCRFFSQPGAGTTARLTFPLAEARPLKLQ
jgi:C4-dicarboxylate-specific signal transduction histidine kinase